MAFVSQLKTRAISGAHVRFRKTKSGGAGGTISQNGPFRGKRIDIQIDEDNEEIRIGECAEGVSCTAAGSFSCSINVVRICGTDRISLTDGGDGWWYGSYAD